MTIDAAILSTLRRNEGAAVDATDLARAAGISMAQLSSHVVQLRALGYDIASTPHQGYRLVSSPDVLHADDLTARLGTTEVVGRDIRVFEETTSTNDVIDKLARDGVREGVVVLAETQTKGRGRMGRTWISPRGQGLWFSILLRPRLTPQAATQLTIIGATAIARAIRRHTPLIPQIKWPNDILIDGKKVVGILTELSAELDQVKHVTLGIGVDVNVTRFPPDLQPIATSLAIAAGHRIDRPELAATILRELDADYIRICAGEFAAVAEEWESQCITVGRRVRIDAGDHTLRGRAESLDKTGALLLRTDHGHLEQIIGGDVVIEAD
jgi:BirA family biotin operon repressor/biotin-[acetyl-CoA-carboxylase] ligase